MTEKKDPHLIFSPHPVHPVHYVKIPAPDWLAQASSGFTNSPLMSVRR